MLTIIKSFKSHKGGTNNLTVVHAVNGFCKVKTFTGKTAEKRATKFINQ